jgi:predicted nucleic acid-binding protein
VTEAVTRQLEQDLLAELSELLTTEHGPAPEEYLAVTSAINLTEVLCGGTRDATVQRVLSRITVLPVTAQIARRAGELLGAAGLAGHRCAIDAIVAATAPGLERPVVLLTSDLDVMKKLTGEPGRPAKRRIAVVRV